MIRDEVLERLEVLAGQYERAFGHSLVADVFEDRAKLLRAAAEVIRESGWRSLHHGLDRDTALTCGKWEELPNGKHRWYCYQQKITPGYAMALGLTHYLPEPEPPALEDSKS